MSRGFVYKENMCTPWLPGEVWTLIFRYLPLWDRLRVRATCKYFMELVDDSALWRDWTVELRGSKDEEEGDFWRALRRWRVTSARLTSPHSWTHIAKELPGLTSLIIKIRKFTEMQDLKSFTNLERLHLTQDSSVRLEELSLWIPHWLTHLRVCQPYYNTTSLPPEIPPDSPFKKLRSLALSCTFDSHAVNALHFFLSSLPQLQHLSLLAVLYRSTSFEGHISDLPPLNNCCLSSLELLDCDTKKFPMDFMKMLSSLSFLRSLAISCQCDDDDDDDDDDEQYDESEKLSAWLRDLPGLTSLLVQCSQTVGFVRSIPPSVTRLILVPYGLTSEDMSALSATLPNLRSLQLVVMDSEMDADESGILPVSEMALIPRLFPGLRTLRLFYEQVPEEAFLSLASLKELEVLETLDEEPLPAALVSKLQELTNNRVRIYSRRGKESEQSCYCLSDVSTDYWA